MVPFALMGVCALTTVACDVEDNGDDAGTTTTTTTTEPDTTAADHYYSVIVDDSEQFDGRCATSNSGAHGADIDAIELLDGSTSLGYLTFVSYEAGTACTVNFNDPNKAKGAPDGELTSGFVSLGGGHLTGEFGTSVLEIVQGYTISVYEIDDAFCAGVGGGCVGSEKYSIYISSDLDCAVDDSDCTTKLLSDTADGSATVDVPAL